VGREIADLMVAEGDLHQAAHIDRIDDDVADKEV
jgi:hypothetical protein